MKINTLEKQAIKESIKIIESKDFLKSPYDYWNSIVISNYIYDINITEEKNNYKIALYPIYVKGFRMTKKDLKNKEVGYCNYLYYLSFTVDKKTKIYNNDIKVNN
jgi:hypothetical protein